MSLFGNNSSGAGFSFGAANNSTTPSTPAFGANNNTSSGGFGFGANNTNTNNNATGGGLFGTKPPEAVNTTSSFGFGSSNTPSNTQSGGLFGNTNTAATGSGTGLFGGNVNNNTGSLFGSNTAVNTGAKTATGGLLGGVNNNSNNNATSGGLFGTKPATSGSLFGGASNTNAGVAGTSSGLFGAKPIGTLGAPAMNTTDGGLFGNNNATTTPSNVGLFGTKPTATGGLFGNNNAAASTTAPSTSGFLGNNPSAPAAGGLFGAKSAGTTTGTSLFGNNNASSQFAFGAKPALGANSGGSLFSNDNTAGTGLFGQQQAHTQPQQLPQLSAMSKVSDLPPQFQEELKRLDDYIQNQVAIAEFLKAQKSDHKELIESVPRDINYLEKNYASTTQALTADLKFVENFKSQTLESFNDWVEKLIKVYLQLTNPMSNSNNENGQEQGSTKVIIGVSGNRTESELSQQQQQQQALLQQSQNSKKISSINITSTLNSYFISKIEDFKENISKYELILQEVDNCINDLDNNPNNDTTSGLQMVIRTLQEEFQLYVELTNEFAEIHHCVSHYTNDKEKF